MKRNKINRGAVDNALPDGDEMINLISQMLTEFFGGEGYGCFWKEDQGSSLGEKHWVIPARENFKRNFKALQEAHHASNSPRMQRFTKRFLMSLKEGLWVHFGCFGLPSERIAPMEARNAQWERIKQNRACGRLCWVTADDYGAVSDPFFGSEEPSKPEAI